MTEIPGNYCQLNDDVRSNILLFLEHEIANGSRVKFNGIIYSDFETLREYLQRYCDVILPQLEKDLIDKSHKWISDHPDFKL
jgi:hypothetical protein